MLKRTSFTSGVWLSLLLTVELSLPSQRRLPIKLALVLMGECFLDIIRSLFGRGEKSPKHLDVCHGRKPSDCDVRTLIILCKTAT